MRKVKQIFFSFAGLLFLCHSIPIHAQKVRTFQHIYGTSSFETSNSEVCSSVIALPDKGFLMAGVIEQFIYPGGCKILVIRTDSLGRQIWAKTYAGTGTGNTHSGWVGTASFTCAVDMILTPEGNVTICSNTFQSTSVYLFKINLKGSVLWSKTFAGGSSSGLTLGVSIINARGGGYVLTGAFNSASNKCETLVMKTDSSGKILWSNIYYHSGYQEFGVKIISSNYGGYIVSGFSDYDTINPGYTSPADYLIMKIDKNGKLLWSGVYSNSTSTKSVTPFQIANSILELPDKSIYIFGQGFEQGTIIKFDSTGHLLWSKIYNNSSFEYCYFASALYDSVKKTINISCEFATAINEE